MQMMETKLSEISRKVNLRRTHSSSQRTSKNWQSLGQDVPFKEDKLPISSQLKAESVKQQGLDREIRERVRKFRDFKKRRYDSESLVETNISEVLCKMSGLMENFSGKMSQISWQTNFETENN